MKKLLMMLAAVGMIFTACEGGSPDDETNGNPTEQPGGNGGGENGGGNGNENGGENGSGNQDGEEVSNNPLATLTCAPNEILYTTKYGFPIELGNSQGFGGNLAYNTYENGVGRLVFDNDVVAIPNSAFYGSNSMECIKYPDSVTSIGESAFYNCSGLTSITIPNGVTSIGKYAFSGCSGELTIDSKIIENNYTYDNYPLLYGGWLYETNFTKLTIGNNVTSIGDFAFFDCSNLTSITIGSGVTSIGEYAFSGCSSLTRVDITDLSAWCKIVFIDSYANPLYYAKNLYLNGELVTELTIPSDITEIKAYAFYDCASLTSITIPDSVTWIGNAAFCGCSSLTSVTIPDSVTSIGRSAFYNCASLASITIPDSVTSIGGAAFCYCYSLTSVYCKATTPPSGYSSMFYGNASGRKIYVPTASVEAYKSADYWSDYASDIVGYDF